MIIRPARPEDGPAIGKLFQDWPDTPEFDWTVPGIASWWLVADLDGDIVGALQVTASLPAGTMGDLIVRPSMRHHGIAWALFHAGEAALRQAGCQSISTVLVGDPGWVKTCTERAGFAIHPSPAVFVRKDLRA